MISERNRNEFILFLLIWVETAFFLWLVLWQLDVNELNFYNVTIKPNDFIVLKATILATLATWLLGIFTLSDKPLLICMLYISGLIIFILTGSHEPKSAEASLCFIFAISFSLTCNIYTWAYSIEKVFLSDAREVDEILNIENEVGTSELMPSDRDSTCKERVEISSVKDQGNLSTCQTKIKRKVVLQ